ncbi:MAG TPA: hypothetical protein ENN19_06965 [Chloroflexi bacterium]|nr:hypothetical protein [Chloroflexota bacterium]
MQETAVWNETRDQLLLERVRHCRRYLCRLRGLTFRRSLGQNEGLLLIGQRESRLETAIHMLFVFFPITVVWLDADGWVLDVRLARPCRPIYVPRVPAQDVLEGGVDLIRHVSIGDRLYFGEQTGV